MMQSNPPDRPDMRASDEDRERVAEQLREAAGDGRLTLAELEERLDVAYQARTYGELTPLTSDLPDPARPSTASPAPPPDAVEAPGEISTVLGSEVLNGRFVAPRQMRIKAVLGEVKIDFTEAVVPRGEMIVDAACFLGEVRLTVPEGVDVRLEAGTNVLGERKNKLPPPSTPDAPVIRVRGTVVLGSVTVRPRRWRKLRWALES